jgi:hypothetical protein
MFLNAKTYNSFLAVKKQCDTIGLVQLWDPKMMEWSLVQFITTSGTHSLFSASFSNHSLQGFQTSYQPFPNPDVARKHQHSISSTMKEVRKAGKKYSQYMDSTSWLSLPRLSSPPLFCHARKSVCLSLANHPMAVLVVAAQFELPLPIIHAASTCKWRE